MGAAPQLARRCTHITSTEWRWLILATVATLLLVEVPYLLAYWQETRGWAFSGMLWWPHDFAQYAAAMREGAASSSWLIHDHLTAESHQPVLMYPLYVALGKLAGFLDLDLDHVYHGARLATGSVLLVAIYEFSSAIYPSIKRRRLAFVVIVFASATAYRQPEVSTFLVLFLAPHLMLGLACLLLSARHYLVAWSERGLRYPAATVVTVLGLGLTNPFSLVTLGTVLAAHLTLMWVRHRCLPRSALLCAGTAFLVAAPFLSYNLLVFGADPFWGLVYGQQNVTLSVPPDRLAKGLGFLLVVAGLGLPAFARRLSPGRWLVCVWIAVSLALMYAPVGVQRRFALGLQPMLGLLAVLALEQIWKWTRHGRTRMLCLLRQSLAVELVAAIFASTAYFYGIVVWATLHPSAHLGQDDSPQPLATFQPASLKEAGRWLATRMEPDDVVLAETLTGNYLAGMLPVRVFVVHWAGTLDYARKEEAMRRFYGDEDEQSVRRAFLAANFVRFIVYGPHEQELSATPPRVGDFQRLVYSTAGVRIDEVDAALAGAR